MGDGDVRYPEDRSPLRAELPERHRRFAELREEYLLDYGYNTARAYWGDLEHLFDWAEERGKDLLALTDQDLKQYYALLRRRGYSESTVRRRRTAWRGLQQVAQEAAEDAEPVPPGTTREPDPPHP